MPLLVFETAFHIASELCQDMRVSTNADKGGRSAVRKLDCGKDVVHFYFEA
ncbi:hypothetical protein [Nostoc sp. UIC 10630]|uniref:hypothetical protein n=1 Tax=Nostoc sp. UIC 10630 TaxID=2100146 RepID=UPI001A9C99E5|nr:hypothetical protein [Nostoc sp. UIC 10630]